MRDDSARPDRTAAAAAGAGERPGAGKVGGAGEPAAEGDSAGQRPAAGEGSPGADAAPRVALTRRGAQRARGPHPWIYRSDIGAVHARGGDVVRVIGPGGREFGFALYSDRSQIALRLLDHRAAIPDEEFWRRRLQQAIAARALFGIEGDAYRLVHAEADLLPGLIVDRYGDYLVVQALTQAADRLSPLFTRLLVRQLAPRGVLARNDPRVRELEGLERRVEVLEGTVPERVSVRAGRATFEVDLRHDQKTGLFLDQRENWYAAGRYAHGRLLDAFSYHGGFALHLAPACDSVVAVEVSADAAARIRRNADLNGCALQVREANVFDELRRAADAGERYDTVVLDPPAFAKNKAAVERAVGGYKEINLRAMKLLPVGGVLVTCSCSYHVSEQQFLAIVQAAAADVGAVMTVLERRGQARDHPVRLGHPESAYLKCLMLRRIG